MQSISSHIFHHRGRFLFPISSFKTLQPYRMNATTSIQVATSQQPTLTSSSTSSDSSNVTPPKKAQLALPEASSNIPGSTTTELDMSTGETSVKLGHLGPMVVNVDGTLSRISNWESMADIEKKNTLRIIGRRNKQRLDAIKATQEGGNLGQNGGP